MKLRFLIRNRRAVFVLAVFVASVLVMTGSWRGGEHGRRRYLEEAGMALAGPLLEASMSAAAVPGRAFDFLLGWRWLREENRALREQVAVLNRELEARREETLAFRRLEEILEFRRSTGYPMQVAAVIGRDTTGLFETVLLNKGRLDGLAKDMAVVTPAGVVGKTIRVYDRTARVLLLTDRSSGIATIVQRTRDQGVAQGNGEGACSMKYLSRQSTVAVGDVIVTSGLGGVFPKGVRVGRVADVKRSGYLLPDIEVLPTASLDRLEEVIVLLSGRAEEGEE